jgi:hypothetical protein
MYIISDNCFFVKRNILFAKKVLNSRITHEYKLVPDVLQKGALLILTFMSHQITFLNFKGLILLFAFYKL